MSDALEILGTKRDPLWQAAEGASAYVIRSVARHHQRGGDWIQETARALERVVPGSAAHLREALRLGGNRGEEPTPRLLHRASSVALANALLDRYLELGKRVWEARSDPRLVNPLEKAGLAGSLGGLGDSDLKKAEQIMTGVACSPAAVGVVSGIVGAVTYGIGGAIVATGGTVAQQAGCPSGGAASTEAPAPTPPPPPAPPASGIPSWVVPVAVGSLFFLALGGLVIYGASQ